MTISRFIYKCFNALERHIYSFYFSLTTFIEYVYLLTKGIQFRKGCIFRGKTSFYRCDKSKIIIGKQCVFNSSNYANHLGLAHKCILATHNQNTQIIIGDNCGFSGVSINAFQSIIIGNHVRCGANVIIMDGDFHLDDARTPSPSPIIIGDNVWICEGARILKGVTIGHNSIIGAGSIVTKNIPENVVAAGTPCKIIRNL